MRGACHALESDHHASFDERHCCGRDYSAASDVSDFVHYHIQPNLDVPGGADADAERLGKLAIFEGVSEFPSRVKCATLAWHSLRAALRGGEARVSTE